MAKRNRAQELKRHGVLKEGFRIPEAVKVPVTDEDRRLFGGLALWSHAYVNFVYEHAGHDGRQQPKRLTEPVWWRLHGDDERISISAGARDLPYAGYVNEHTHQEYRRQREQGVGLHISTVVTSTGATRPTNEDLYLDLDADGVVASGRYHWYAAENQMRPAPDAEFNDVDSAHVMTVSGRAAYLLGRYRDLILESPSGMRIDGTWSNSENLPPIPPELIPIPEFRN